MKFSEFNEIMEYCLSKPCAYETRPFGEYPICYRLAGKIFAQFTPKEEWFKITLKTNPDSADFYRQTFKGIVVPGYHCPPVQQPYWNSIDLYHFEKELLLQMIDQAYDEILAGLTKKEQRKIPEIAKYRFMKTEGTNKKFLKLCEKLDSYLDEMIGKKKQEEQYNKYNSVDSIHDVIIAFEGDKAVGCGSYKLYDDETVEIKRMYIDNEYRGRGVGKELLRRIEADARIAGFRFAVLETNELLESALSLYKRMKYKQISNYGQYAQMSESICMKKKL